MKNNLKFTFYTIFHPVDGFWDMKREKRGSLPFCLLILFLHFTTMVIKEFATGFIFDTSLGNTDSIPFIFAVAVLPVFLFSLANLSVTTFLEGEGKWIDIFMMTCYSLIPYIIISIVTTVLSNVMSLDEQTYISILLAIAVIWVIWLMFTGTMQIHNYSASRTLASVLLTFVAMVIIIFLLLLFLDMVSSVFGFGYSIFQEIQTRS